MALWWETAQEAAARTIKRSDVIHQWNKAARLARRSIYGGLRYSKQVALWGNKKVSKAFVAIFPNSKAAFIKQDPLIGLEHGPSSYFLASLSKKDKPAKKTLVRRKKVIEIETVSEEQSDLSA